MQQKTAIIIVVLALIAVGAIYFFYPKGIGQGTGSGGTGTTNPGGNVCKPLCDGCEKCAGCVVPSGGVCNQDQLGSTCYKENGELTGQCTATWANGKLKECRCTGAGVSGQQGG